MKNKTKLHLIHNMNDGWPQERGSLATARLADPNHISASHEERHSLGLDGCGLGETGSTDRLDQVIIESQVSERTDRSEQRSGPTHTNAQLLAERCDGVLIESRDVLVLHVKVLRERGVVDEGVIHWGQRVDHLQSKKATVRVDVTHTC